MMGGMGRTFDGGYAEFTCVPAKQVIAFRSGLDWAILGAIPEMLQTAHGSLTVGLDARPGRRCWSAAARRRSGWPPRSSPRISASLSSPPRDNPTAWLR
jgi:hypothetical protein